MVGKEGRTENRVRGKRAGMAGVGGKSMLGSVSRCLVPLRRRRSTCCPDQGCALVANWLSCSVVFRFPQGLKLLSSMLALSTVRDL